MKFLKYTFRSEFYANSELYDDLDYQPPPVSIYKIIDGLYRLHYQTVVNEDVRYEIDSVKLSEVGRRRYYKEMYYESSGERLDWKHMTINIDNY